MSNNPNAGSFFTTDNGQPTSSGTAVAGFFTNPGDVFLQNLRFVSGTLTAELNNGDTISVDIGGVNSHVSGVTFDSSNRRLTVNRSDGQSFSANIPGSDDISFTDNGGTSRVLSTITFDSSGDLVFSDEAGNTRTFAGGDIGGRLWTSSDTYAAGDIVSENSRIFISQTSNNTGNSPLTDSTNWREFEGGSPAPHARLRLSLTLSDTSIQLPILGTRPITGTVTSEIVDSQTGDVINDTIITSVHSSYADDRISGPVVVSDTESRFIWSATTADTTARTITFTVSGSVNYVIGTQRMTHAFNETINLTLVAAPVLFWTGAITQPDLDTLSTTTNLADNIIAGIPRLTQRENFSSPYTLEYDGGAAGATPSLYAAIIVDQNINIASLRAEGISLSISSHNDSTVGRTLYVTEGLLSEGPHNLTWRT